MHEGHREKMRTRIEAGGLDSLAEHEVLETLLYFTHARGDTNPIAHRLIERFGNLAAVLEAPREELLQMEGVGPKTAELLSLMPHYARRYLTSRQAADRPLSDTEALGAYLLPHFVGVEEERVLLLCMDNRCKPIICKCIHHGSVNAVEVSVRNVVSTALSYNATAVVLAHNHPGGVALPSNDDILTTRRVMAALETVHVTLVDHIVVANSDTDENPLGDYVSLSDSGLLSESGGQEEPLAAQTYRVR